MKNTNSILVSLEAVYTTHTLCNLIDEKISFEKALLMMQARDRKNLSLIFVFLYKRREKEKMLKQKKGITLIALVVTIIVLLILAGVTIMSIMGENGIVTKGQNASIKTENGKVAEMFTLKATDLDLDNDVNGLSEAVINKLVAIGYINADLVVDANKVTGESLKTGKGTLDTGDVYYLKEIDLGMYHLMYLNSSKVENIKICWCY